MSATVGGLWGTERHGAERVKSVPLPYEAGAIPSPPGALRHLLCHTHPSAPGPFLSFHFQMLPRQQDEVANGCDPSSLGS